MAEGVGPPIGPNVLARCRSAPGRHRAPTRPRAVLPDARPVTVPGWFWLPGSSADHAAPHRHRARL